MFKRCRFIVALLVCVCVFSCGIVDSACAVDFTKKSGETGNCSETFFNALKTATGGTDDSKVTIDVTNITGLKFTDGKITAYVKSGESPFTATTGVPVTSITDLTGINEFTALESLDLTGCTNASLTALDVTGIPGIISKRQYKIASGGNTLYRSFLYPDTIKSKDVTCGPKFYAKQLVLTEGSLKMYFFMEFDDNTTKPEGSTMEFIVGESSKKTTMTADYSESVTLTDYYDSTNHTFSNTGDDANKLTHYGFACDVTSIQMADNIFAEFKPSSESTATAETNYSVKDYLNAVIGQETESESNTIKLANAIKNYGHYVQKPLSTLRGWTLSTGDTFDHQIMEYASVITDVPLTTNESADITAKKLVSSDKSLNAGCALQLDSKITLLVYLPSGITGITVKKNDATEALATSAYSVNDTEYAETDKTVVAIPRITAYELDDKYEITFTHNSNSHSVTAYGLSYVYSVLNLNETQKTALKDSSTNLTDDNIEQFVTDLRNAVIALYRYHTAEKSYNE